MYRNESKMRDFIRKIIEWDLEEKLEWHMSKTIRFQNLRMRSEYHECKVL